MLIKMVSDVKILCFNIFTYGHIYIYIYKVLLYCHVNSYKKEILLALRDIINISCQLIDLNIEFHEIQPHTTR